MIISARYAPSSCHVDAAASGVGADAVVPPWGVLAWLLLPGVPAWLLLDAPRRFGRISLALYVFEEVEFEVHRVVGSLTEQRQNSGHRIR